MRIRATKLYKTMTLYHACEIIEGFGSDQNPTEEEQLTAWQYISDTGAYRQLQGFYGRTVYALRESGIIQH